MKRALRKPTTRMARLAARLKTREMLPWWRPKPVTRHGQTGYGRNQGGSELRTTHSRAKRNPNLHAHRRRLNARKQQVTLRSTTCVLNGSSSLEKGRR